MAHFIEMLWMRHDYHGIYVRRLLKSGKTMLQNGALSNADELFGTVSSESLAGTSCEENGDL